MHNRFGRIMEKNEMFLIVLQVRRRLSEIFAQSQAEIETLKKTENELRMGQSKLEDLGRRLDQEQVTLK